jgi:hypothetical protein
VQRPKPNVKAPCACGGHGSSQSCAISRPEKRAVVRAGQAFSGPQARKYVRSRWRNSMLCGFQAIDDKGGLTKVECVDALFGCATNCEGEVLCTGSASGLELDERFGGSNGIRSRLVHSRKTQLALCLPPSRSLRHNEVLTATGQTRQSSTQITEELHERSEKSRPRDGERPTFTEVSRN